MLKTGQLDGKGGSVSQSIDFERIAESIDLPKLIGLEGIEIRNGKAFCPFHDNTSTPAMSVYHSGGRWRFKCHSCGEAGDAIGWVAGREGITAIQAAKKLSGDPDYHVQASTPPQRSEQREEESPPWHDPEWQAAVEEIVTQAQHRLEGHEGREAMEWLRSRGLQDHTIRRFRLGFVAEPFWTSPIEAVEDRGRQRGIYSPRGITIPWLAPRASYSGASSPVPRWAGVNVRKLADDVFADLPSEGGKRPDKYKALLGSRRGHLYPWPDILPTQGDLPMLLAEGEFDALLATQEIGHVLHVATVGSASVRSLPMPTRSALALTTWILLAFDHDSAGAEAAKEWREKFPQKSRRVLLPTGKDIGEYVQAGGSLRAWIAEELTRIAT